MKILNINFRDYGGGAANASLRLTKSLIKNDITTNLGVYDKKTSLRFVIKLRRKHNKIITLLLSVLHHFLVFFCFKTDNSIVHDLNFFSKIDVNQINESDYDIIHLHGLDGNTLSIKDIARIKKPIVWTLHDSWPCCGAEHHPDIINNDTRYKHKYNSKNKPDGSKYLDLCKYVWKQKKKYLTNKEIYFIAPSNWEYSIIKNSSLFCNNECRIIPNIVEKSIFHKKNTTEIKEIFCIPFDKKIIGFGAAYGVDNPRSLKGTYYFLEALKKLESSNDYYLIIFGPTSSDFTSRINIPFFEAGYINNDIILSCLYNACDCFINTSLVESFGYTSLESIFCGTPVVAFDSTGTKDIVKHKITGYLAELYNVSDLVNGIHYCIKNKDSIQSNCLTSAQTDFYENIITKEHINYYNYIIKNSTKIDN